METAIYIKDLNLYEVTLNKYTTYKIKNRIISNPTETLMLTKDEFENIRKVTNTKIISHYIYNGKKEISIIDFNEKINKLKKDGGYNTGGEYSCSTWQNIDKEYEYKKFKQNCQIVYKDVQLLSEPYEIDIKHNIISDINNKYITAKYLLNGEPSSLYYYNRIKAIIHIINTTFNKLGYEFKAKIDYSDTKSKKIYSYGNTGIEYMIAWGTYITPQEYKNIYNPINKLEYVQELYENDIKFWKEYITRRNKEYFSIVDLSKYNLASIFKIVNDMDRDLYEHYFKKSYNSEYRLLRNRIKNLKTELNKILNEQTKISTK